MADPIRVTLTALSGIFVAVGGYYRIQSQRSGERLDRSQEGWPLFFCIRLIGLGALGSAAAWLYQPAWFRWATVQTPVVLRWLGVAVFAGAIGWLLWMFHTLGRNATDTVVTRRDAYFVDYGPFRFVRNPMYSGVLPASIGFGLALGAWLWPLAGCMIFICFVLRTKTEEKFLVARFGDRYLDYTKRVGRFFPRF